MKMKKLGALMLAGLMAISLTGCGGGSSSGSEEKTYIIATDKTYPPFEMEDDSGKLIGVDMDLIRAIAKDQKFKIKINSLGFDAACTALESGEADGVIAGMTITDARKEKYDFSDEYYETGVSMGVAKDSGIKSYDDLKGKTVVAKTSTAGLQFAESIKDKYGFDLEVVEESTFMFEKVKSGEAVACFEDTPVLKSMIKTGELDFDTPCGNENPAYYGFAVLKGENKTLLKKFNKGLANLKKNGKYDKILAKYE